MTQFHLRSRSLTGFRHDKHNVSRRKRWIIYASLFIVVLVVLRTPLADSFAYLSLTIARPFWSAGSFSSQWLEETGTLFRSKRSLVEENIRLKDALDSAALEAYSRDRLRGENEDLKGALGRTEKRDILLARVIAAPGRSPYDTLVVDVGSDHGVLAGMKVLFDGDFVIGTVDRVAAGSAVVTLFSSHGTELPVTVGTSSVPATMTGEGGGNFRITLPRGVSVFRGDLVEIPAFAPSYAGVVEAVEEREGGSLEDLFVQWPFNVNELRFIYVVLSERSSE
ncbi:MAG: hypothetical protein A3C93_06435 [Candidatus Lloydbacteria bacterium RIFCSPHIGHO2_02_FULL_54_17]|uniref:Rod shape-determining protein MreC beta-barrel core domain-containing protein n=1 Tax=Candidatus Lloydbacteria bacterium RIFCSPHIGHO2_02_FULL_54_17 TaxID=1798664 RepID=A0A1G2DGC7_9BACT|nr:MAG: hypothetical protein A2762_01420 [Candidatus Lloydbacteria bacterium RIFCSPHIGHO2_01_FULL_54_11]OGZ12714.1 MAG: hypothetical protein A3C93_06435 [Candidatus Lloydbacteria bacterium RIFCSPHIGHO2_02_FULL_54_17]OGZ13565.1 MAG: hypothetical protein A2948_05095 [Candidatus Lloydbacteria bacterium RIFCSPLOWO2_01_FULL_54_18]OGZ16233.1 MAG: hypothetical protein A3H76_03925 [Candidatus Lloydbacteria bacterium RIFCSPLOWO2_02_FULL_54_12]